MNVSNAFRTVYGPSRPQFPVVHASDYDLNDDLVIFPDFDLLYSSHLA